MFIPDGYTSSENSDEDDIEYYGLQKDIPAELTNEEKHAKLLNNLFSYVQMGDIEKTIALLDDNNLEVDVPLHQDWTALILAASYGHYELTKHLIQRGADINQVKDMMSVLMHVCNVSKYNPNYEKAVDLVKLLVENKCDVNYKNNKRMTAYLFAASHGNIDIIKYLRRYCDTDAADNQGWNALFYAVNDNHYKLVKYLLKMGMDHKKHDVRHNIPLFYARQNSFRKVEELLTLDAEVKEKQYETYLCETYDYKTEIANPKFMKDVNIMLYGMNCGSMLSTFHERPMDLFKFLTLTREDLIAMDVTKPYQLNRILGGLYQFHGHPFKYKSIPHIEKNSILLTYDVGFTMFSAVRHYVTMQATLKYLRLNVKVWDDKVITDIEVIEKQMKNAKKLIKQLQARCTRWEKENARVDKITYPSKQKTNKFVYFVPVITAISIVWYFKYRV